MAPRCPACGWPTVLGLPGNVPVSAMKVWHLGESRTVVYHIWVSPATPVHTDLSQICHGSEITGLKPCIGWASLIIRAVSSDERRSLPFLLLNNLNITSGPSASDARGLQTTLWELLVQLPDARVGIEKIFFFKCNAGNIYTMLSRPGTLRTQHKLGHLVLTTILKRDCYYPHFTDAVTDWGRTGFEYSLAPESVQQASQDTRSHMADPSSWLQPKPQKVPSLSDTAGATVLFWAPRV